MAPGLLIMLGLEARQYLLMSSSQSEVRIAPGCHANRAMCTARDSSCMGKPQTRAHTRSVTHTHWHSQHGTSMQRKELPSRREMYRGNEAVGCICVSVVFLRSALTLLHPDVRLATLLIRHLYTSPSSLFFWSSARQNLYTSDRHALRRGGSSFQLACLRTHTHTHTRT